MPTIHDTMLHVLYRATEVPDGEIPPDALRIEGVVRDFALHPGRVEEKRADVLTLFATMLGDAAESYHRKGGGGQSFLDFGGRVGSHQEAESLLVIGIALGIAGYCAPKELWRILPGGLPYVWVDIEAV